MREEEGEEDEKETEKEMRIKEIIYTHIGLQ